MSVTDKRKTLLLALLSCLVFILVLLAVGVGLGVYFSYRSDVGTVIHPDQPTPSAVRCGSVDEICKPLTDQSEYRVITLNNSLRVLLISNNETTTSAAAVDVYVGSFYDGDIEGLAHFCEHMLFLGTEKYPDEAAYSTYLTINGGPPPNAYTAPEYTNYYFSVNSDKLEGALDHLAQLFVSPLFNESGVDREKNAVDSEYQLYKSFPDEIDYLVAKGVADPVTPFSRFDVGSLETLNVSDLVEQVKAFYINRYSANLMQVAIYGRDDLDTLQNWATQYFGDIPNRNLNKPYPIPHPYSNGYTSRIIVYKPLESTPFIKIIWQTPSLQDKYRYRVSYFLESLFTFTAEGSIDRALRDNGLVTSVGFHVNGFIGFDFRERGYSNFTLYTLTIELTLRGEEFLNEIVSTVFAFIKHLQNSNSSELERVWRSLKDLEQLKFDYASQLPTYIEDYASNLARDMRTTKDPVDFLSPPQRFLWDPELVKSVIDSFTPDNANIFYGKPSLSLNAAVAPPSHTGSCLTPPVKRHGFNVSSVDLVEPAYDTPYGVYCTPVELIEMWENVPALEGARLPRFDSFVPTELSLLPIPANFTGVPEKILDNQEGFTVWWMQDIQFQNPVQIFRFEAETHVPGETPLSRALSSFYKKYFLLALGEDLYYGKQANYEITFELSYHGIFLEFRGYSDHKVMMKYMQTVLENLVDISQSTLLANWKPLQQALLQTIQEYKDNSTTSLPVDYAFYFSSNVLLEPNFHYEDILNELENINFTRSSLASQLTSFMETVLSSIGNCSCYSTGNVDRKQSLSYGELVQQTLMKGKSATSQNAKDSERKVLMLPKGDTAFAIPTLNPTKDPNSAIFVVDQVGLECEVEVDPGDGTPVTCTEQSLNNTVYSGVLDLLITEPCFDQLRTKEQLGYIVSCGARRIDGVVNTFTFEIQSSVQPPSYLLNRTREFIQAFKDSTVKDTGAFHEALSGYKTTLRGRDSTLEDQVKRIWRQISTKMFRFNRTQELLAVVERVTPEGFLQFYDRYLADRTSSSDGTSGSVRELVIGAFQDVTTLQFYGIPEDRQYQLEDLTSFKTNTTDFWDAY